ncbi:MAG TPA: lamin tail domain-containing protein [Verrucomicrobiae bacterium]
MALSCVVGLLLLVCPGRSQVILSEFMADNIRTLTDDFGEYSDWVEVYNTAAIDVNLLDWGLTDTADKPFKWQFPATNLASRSSLLVYASNRDRRTPGQPLHTNFRLSASGEYLALTRPDGTTATVFAPAYPPQVADVSFGYGAEALTWKLLTTGTVGAVKVPLGSSLGATWTSNGFNHSTWTRATNGIGFESGSGEFGTNVMGDVLAGAPLGFWRLDETGTNGPVLNSGSSGSSGNGQFKGAATNTAAGPRPAEFPGFESNNRAASFNGSNGTVDMPYSAAFNPNGPFSVECWVKPGVVNSSTFCPVSCQYYVTPKRDGFVIYQVGAQWQFRIGNDSGYIAYARGGLAVAGLWSHVVGVYDGTTAALYVDGILAGSSGLSGTYAPNPSSPFRIGAGGGGAYVYNGKVDEVAFFNRALDAPEIARRYDIATSATNNYAALIQTDLRSAMYGVNGSVYFRIPFVVSNAPALTQLLLRVKCDDGFAAWLNGTPTVAANAPATLSWNSTATARQATADALDFVEYDLSSWVSALREGTNVLALQGLNYSATNGDFLLVTELEARAATTSLQAAPRYFVTPTPGAENGAGSAELGPILTFAGHTPQVPSTNESITITCRVAQALAPVSSVTLNWRVMYGGTTSQPMYDDGLHGDGLAGDGIYGATIPNREGAAWTYTAGQMVRWSITAVDSMARVSRWPLFQDPLDSAEYLGTVVQPDSVSSQLPIIHLFVSNYTAGVGVDNPDRSGGRASVFYDGEFYDNVFMCVRGNSTRGYSKKSHRFEFNHEHQFRHPGPGGMRLRKTSFTADYPDPTYIRQGLSFWLCEQAGAPGPFYHPVRLQMNGSFYQLANHNDVHGEELLRRLGYDPDGALYNAAGTVVPSQFSTGGFDKKTRQWEGNADYTALANAISETLPIGTRRTNIFDLLDLPEVINYMAAARFVHENDDVWANMSLYHDNDGDGLWRIIPFDMNLSWGAAYLDSSNDDGIQVTNDLHKSFPMYGSSKAIALSPTSWNRLYDVIFSVPSTREMFLRRLRTLLDTWVKPPGTATNLLVLEPLVWQWRDLIIEEAQRDRAKWGWPAKGGQSNFDPGIDLTDGVNILIEQFLNKRREHFYGKHSITNTGLTVGISKTDNAGIPLAQPGNPILSFRDWDYNPASGNQDEEYVCLTNANDFAVDLSGWKLSGGIDRRLQPGTVIPAFGALYLTPNVVAFRARANGPRSGMGLLVQGNCSGHLNAWGDSFVLSDPAGLTVCSNGYAGVPSAAQRYLRITEIMYNPAGAPAINADPQQFEYLELRNISINVTLDLTGVRLTNGVYFNFSGGSVTSLAPGATVLVVRNRSAFVALYGSGQQIAGEFGGALDNGGETIRLEDAVGEKILEFAYDNRWYPITDGLGFSLVIVDDLAPWDTWGLRESWRVSGRLLGSPGAADPPSPATAPVRVSEVLAHTDPPQIDSIELENPTGTNVDISGWWLTDDFYAPFKYRIPQGTSISTGGFLVLTANEFGAGAQPFLLSEYGDGAFLLAADSAGNLSGYCHGFDFPASPNGVSFGQYLTSEGEEHWVLQSAVTLGRSNAAPRVGPIVISEIMYHPPDLPGGGDNDQDEFIELQNITTTNVPLYCVFTQEPGYGLAALTNTWRLRNAVDYDFPTNTVLAAGRRLLVVGFDPATNTTQFAAFRNRYGVGAALPVFGPWRGKLDNSSDTIELKYPDKPDVGPTNLTVPFVMAEKVTYHQNSPWPTNADGFGSSLQRRDPAAYGNDPINWFAGVPSAGTNNAEVPSILVQPQGRTVAAGDDVLLSVSAVGTAPLSYQWRRWSTNVAGATADSLLLPGVAYVQAGDYCVVISNSAGAVTSAVATLTISIPQPAIRAVSVGNHPVMVNLTATAGATYLLEYKQNLSDPSWTAIPPVVRAEADQVTLVDTNPPAVQRFYRVQQQ